MTTSLSTAPERDRFFPIGEPVWALRHDGPLHGDQVWDFTALVTRTSQSERRINLAHIEDGYRNDVATVLGILAQPDHPNVIAAGVVRRGVAAPTASIIGTFEKFRTISRWGASNSLITFADWTQSDADAFGDALRTGTHRAGAESGLGPSGVRRFISALRMARTFASALDNPLPFMPWGARTSAEVAGEKGATENLNAPLPWETWAPLVAGAWAFVDRFSPDIVAADQAARALPPGPRGAGGWATFQQWHANGGVLPLATGFGRSPQPRGKPNLRLLCRTLRVNENFLKPVHNMYQPETVEMVAELKDDHTRCTYGGLLIPTVQITHDDGRTTPWISELGLGEWEYLVSALRGACYVIIASLTGTRDSELQEMKRDAVTVADGLEAIASVQTKGRVVNPNGNTRTWWAPKPVTRAVEVLAQVSPHPTHLFARSATNAGHYDPTRDIRRLIDFVNGDPAQRPGRGHGLGLGLIAPADDNAVHATSLRRSFAVYAVTKPEAELGLGIQLGHSAWRLVSGYASDGQERAVKHMDRARRAVLRDEAMQLITGGTPLAGAPAAGILNFRAQVVTDSERAARLAEQVAERLHLGLTNDCMFNPATSGCGADGPHLADHYCIGDDCANALFTPHHTPVITNAIERIDLALDNPRGNPDLIAAMRRSRQTLARLRRELTTNRDDD